MHPEVCNHLDGGMLTMCCMFHGPTLTLILASLPRMQVQMQQKKEHEEKLYLLSCGHSIVNSFFNCNQLTLEVSRLHYQHYILGSKPEYYTIYILIHQMLLWNVGVSFLTTNITSWIQTQLSHLSIIAYISQFTRCYFGMQGLNP